MRWPWKRRRRPADGPIDILLCVHATGRSRRLLPGADEGKCGGCDVRVLFNKATVAGFPRDMVLVCPSCASGAAARACWREMSPR